MFIKTKYLLIVFPALVLSACGSNGGGTTQKSFDVSYTSASVVANVNDAVATDSSPEISSSGLELFFHSNRTGGEGVFDLMVSTRASIMDAWGTATNLGAIVNSTANDKAPDLSDNGLTMIFASDRAGGEGSLDLYVITRPSLIGAWTAPVNLGNTINTVFNESGPSLTSDGLSLYFHSNAPGVGLTDLWVSTRASIVDPWGPPVSLGATINSIGNDSAPEISSDGLTLYFHSTRTGSPGTESIWQITRTRVTNPWGTPTVVAVPVNSNTAEAAPGLSDDWQTIYFASNRGASRDIWQAVP